MFQTKFVEKSKYTFVFSNFFRASCRLQEKVEEYCILYYVPSSLNYG